MTPSSILSLFGRFAGPFLVPVEIKAAAGRGRGQERPAGRRVPRLALDADKPGCTVAAAETTGKTPRAWRASVAWIAAFNLLATSTPATARRADPPVPVRATPGSEIAQAVSEASLRFGLPEAWIYAVMRQESGGRTNAVSVKGSMGLLQLMPGTWRDLTLELGLGDDPYDVRANVLAGSAYLRRMYDRFGFPGFLAAYNFGPQRYANHLMGAEPLPLETRAYVERLAPLLRDEQVPVARVGAMETVVPSLFVAPNPTGGPLGADPGKRVGASGLWP